MLRTSFYTVTCHAQIVAWKQVYYSVLYARRARRYLEQIRPMAREIAREAIIYLVACLLLGSSATLAGALLAPALGF